MDLPLLFNIFHIIGVALGAGGAFVSDFMFFSSIRDGKIERTEMRFLKLGSRAVWIGLLLLILSGIGSVYLNPAFLESGKFWAKMTIVLVILLNGIIFHVSHLPLLERLGDTLFRNSKEFIKRAPWLLISGVLSSTSWISAIILGSIRRSPYEYSHFIGVYISILTLGILFALVIKKKIFQLR